MILILCAVRDSAIDAFMPPIAVPALGAAIRGFGDEVQKAGSPMQAHPDDYELFELGEFDEQTGRITMAPQPRSVARAKDYAKPKEST